MRASTIVDRFTPRPEELEALDKAYSRLDSISKIIGVTPSRPVPGEMPYEYRRRLLKSVLPKSQKYKDMSATNIGGMLDVVEDAVYQDAVATAKGGTEFRPLQHRDAAGRLVTTWAGTEYMGPYWSYFAAPGASVTVNRNPPKRNDNE